MEFEVMVCGGCAEILHHKLTLNGYLAEFTGKDMGTITADTDRDFFMSAKVSAPMVEQYDVVHIFPGCGIGLCTNSALLIGFRICLFEGLPSRLRFVRKISYQRA